MKKYLILVLPFIMACSAHAGNPDRAKEGAELSDYFVGSWKVAFPEEEGVIVNIPDADCDAPIVLLADGPERIEYQSPKGGGFKAEIFEFNARITWVPDENNQYTFIAERKDADKFWLYTTVMGKADWDNPKEYTRCKSN